MDILLVMEESMDLELLLPFIRYLKKSDNEDAFTKKEIWKMYQKYISKNIKSLRYKYLLEAQRQLKAIKLFRVGKESTSLVYEKLQRRKFLGSILQTAILHIVSLQLPLLIKINV